MLDVMTPVNSRLIELAQELGISYASLAARGLSECPEAECLEVVERGQDGREHLLVPDAAKAWRSLQRAALDAGISLFIVSAFRSIERQAEIVRRKLGAGSSIDEILAICAPPGFSEHHTGRAVDVSAPGSPSLEVAFDQTPAFAWLVTQANEFGFHLSYPKGNSLGYQYEPWHWCYQDARHSSQIENGIRAVSPTNTEVGRDAVPTGPASRLLP